MEVRIDESWKARLQDEFDKPYFKTLTDFVRQEYGNGVVYPPAKLIFNAFDLCPFDDVKVVNSAARSPNEASFEYFSSVRFSMKFDFSLVWNNSLAIGVSFHGISLI